jgi:UDP-N-acetylglucosamine--N-acetylmuramyl-(pentapeptide) pyrophosphoryl-undecaprenol N-acetylglucosamine transferase
MRMVIVAGGTGGHIYPALAVARWLQAAADRPTALLWVGGHRGLEGSLVPGAGIAFRRLWLRSLRSTQLDRHLIGDPLRLVASVPQAVSLLLRWRPAAVFTTGGFVSLPLVPAASLLGIPVLLWEGNRVPGRSSRLLAPWAWAVAVSFPDTCVALAGGRPCRVTGTPIRPVAAIDRLAARRRWGLAPDDRFVVVVGGSQSARRLNDAVFDALPAVLERVHLLHVTGPADEGRARQAGDALPPALRDRYRPVAFLGDDLLAALAAADLLVGRAGASTIAEATALGLPMVLVPYPHAAGHQRANAEAIAAAGAARIVDDAAFNGTTFRAALSVVEDPALHARMSAAARSLARPGAAAAVGKLLLAAARGEALPTPDQVEAWARDAGDGSMGGVGGATEAGR